MSNVSLGCFNLWYQLHHSCSGFRTMLLSVTMPMLLKQGLHVDRCYSATFPLLMDGIVIICHFSYIMFRCPFAVQTRDPEAVPPKSLEPERRHVRQLLCAGVIPGWTCS